MEEYVEGDLWDNCLWGTGDVAFPKIGWVYQGEADVLQLWEKDFCPLEQQAKVLDGGKANGLDVEILEKVWKD